MEEPGNSEGQYFSQAPAQKEPRWKRLKVYVDRSEVPSNQPSDEERIESPTASSSE